MKHLSHKAELVAGESLEYKIEKIMAEYVLPWLNGN